MVVRRKENSSTRQLDLGVFPTNVANCLAPVFSSAGLVAPLRLLAAERRFPLAAAAASDQARIPI